MSDLVDELERLGYVRRGPDPTDRRAKLIGLTERGEDCVRTHGGALRSIPCGQCEPAARGEHPGQLAHRAPVVGKVREQELATPR